MPDQPNVALVVLDTLRKDAFDEHFDWLPGHRYEQAWAPSHWTLPVHASLFTGRYASELGVHAKSKGFDCPEPALAAELSAAGYTTRAFSNNINISSRNDFDEGFDEFDGGWRLTSVERGDDLFNWGEFVTENEDDSPLRYARALWACLRSDAPTLPSLKWGATIKLQDVGMGPHADDGARETLAYVRDLEPSESGEFLFVNLMEAHLPYAAPREYRTERVDRIQSLLATVEEPAADPDAVRQAYDDCVRYLADIYRDIFAELRDHYDYVVTLSDHGELFGEHGAWAHSYGLYPELTHVPMTVWGPDFETGTTETPVSLLDVHRTVQELAGVDGESRGRSLLSDLSPRPWLTEYHGLDSHQKENLRTAGHGTEADEMDRELCGIAAADYYGFESRDGWTERGDAPTEPQATLDELRADRTVREIDGDDDWDVDDAVQSQLADLGYM